VEPLAAAAILLERRVAVSVKIRVVLAIVRFSSSILQYVPSHPDGA